MVGAGFYGCTSATRSFEEPSLSRAMLLLVELIRRCQPDQTFAKTRPHLLAQTQFDHWPTQEGEIALDTPAQKPASLAGHRACTRMSRSHALPFVYFPMLVIDLLYRPRCLYPPPSRFSSTMLITRHGYYIFAITHTMPTLYVR